MIFVFEIVSPGSDLDGETFDVVEVTRECANRRAVAHVADTFSLASAGRKAVTSHRFIAEYPTMKAYRLATEWA